MFWKKDPPEGFKPYEYRVIRKNSGGYFHAEYRTYPECPDWCPCYHDYFLGRHPRVYNTEYEAEKSCRKHAEERVKNAIRHARDKVSKPPVEKYLGKLP